ncbi:DUF7007 domain-containing protein [Methylocystis sp. JAN1]|jgi:hypothetical protein|uniref:DUF7007 domain-containing protein n=1 Tax=Methylocystis sp. JAN1 TaxID=3397211 RepID=UPI003FA2FD96
MSIHTPWGAADREKFYAEGIVFYSTPSHGGFRLDALRNAKVHPLLREADGYYEEDCAWAKVAFTFPELFSKDHYDAAVATIKNWCPDAYEEIAGVTLAPGESFGKDERRFREEHADHWIVISAIASDCHPGMVECVAARGGVRGRGPERAFLVPQDEYRDRGRFGFVIDEARHALCDRRPESET